jgi:RNA polymerase sigma-70 factor, ECF subfamily
MGVRTADDRPWHHRAVDPAGFLAQLRAALAAPAREALAADAATGDRIAADLAALQARHPALPLDAALVAAFAARIDTQPELARGLPRFRAGDLALAQWAGRGEARAIAAFEAELADVLGRVLARFHRLPADELRQRLRIKLFVAAPAAEPGGAERPARIHDYTGFGFLENWLKVTAVRDFIDLARGEARRRIEDELDDEVLGVVDPATHPALAQARRELGGTVKRAFAAAVAELSPRERNFLRLAHVDGLTLDQIAATYQVHRATVARVLGAARAALLARTRAAVAAEVGADDDRLDSVVGLLDSRLDLSLSRVLRAEPA